MSQELWIIFIFGLGFLATRLVLAIRFPTPTKDQEAVFRTVLSPSAAGIAAAIPGLMKFESQAAATTISATGALAVFALVYLLNPASPRAPSTTDASGNAGTASLGDELQPLLRRLDELSSEIRNLAQRVEHLEARPSGANEPMPAPPARASVRQQRVLLVVFSGVLIAMLLVYALAFPSPSQFQAVLLRVVFALMGAGVGVLIPGTLSVASGGIRLVLRAVSALALFIIIYFFAAASV